MAERGLHDASAYIGELLREAQKRAAQEKLEALLLEGLDSGESTPMTAQDWHDIRSEGRARLDAAKRG